MPKTGVTTLPLHSGKAPRWLFKRMVSLSREMSSIIIYEHGIDEFLRRLSNPFWFQAFSCVLGYDWHSSGTTTVTCGALKEAVNCMNLGVTFTGGKGKASQNTLEEIQTCGETYNFSTSLINRLKYCSRMTAKVDNTAIQDGHSLYHHVFLVSETKQWVVIQQGMNDTTGFARRYHWLSEDVDNFVCEPHTAIIGEGRQDNVLDMTAKQSNAAQKVSVDLINDNPMHLKEDWANLIKHQNQTTLDDWFCPHRNNTSVPQLDMPRSINWEKMKQIYDVHPTTYEELLAMRGVGPMTIRALALISDLLYGEKPSWDDPIRYTFAHGGKDGVPHPVDIPTYEASIQILKDALTQAKIGQRQKLDALKRLQNINPPLPLHPFIRPPHHSSFC
ncbi:MAG: DUF763 domain-containing protein [Candidatus Thermoplasmatota archaeon]|nr:DUF763 domain-containing protein [Candidatus Thermoplasmatota archaeon]